MTLTREQVQANLERYKRFHDEAVYCGDDMSRLAEALLQAWDEVERLRESIKSAHFALTGDYVGTTIQDGEAGLHNQRNAAETLRQALEVRE